MHNEEKLLNLFERMDERISSMDNRLEKIIEIKENTSVTREAANIISVWADDVAKTAKVPFAG